MEMFLHQLRDVMGTDVEGLRSPVLTIHHNSVTGILHSVFTVNTYSLWFDPGQSIRKGQSPPKFCSSLHFRYRFEDIRTRIQLFCSPKKLAAHKQYRFHRNMFSLSALFGGTFVEGWWDWCENVLFWIYGTRSIVLSFHRWKCSW